MHEMTLYAKILESNLINFIIMVSVLVAIFKKFKLGTIFDKMADDIRTSVMTSSEAAQAALKEYKEAKRNTKNLENTKNEIIKRADDTAQNARNAAGDALIKEKEALEIQFENKIKADTLKTKKRASKEFLNAVVELSREEIQNCLNSSAGAEIQVKLLDRCIENLDDIDFSEVKI